MQKNIPIEKRSYSLYKPLFYLLLQVILMWEFFWILTGSSDMSSWNYFELFLCAFLAGYFFIKTVKIIKRTSKKSKWSDKIKMQRYLNS